MGSFQNTVAATKKLLAADGWKEFASPSEEPNRFGMDLKKGGQGLSVFFTMPPGEPVHSGVDYNAQWVIADLPFPDDAADIVFDSYRPYLNCVTAGTVEATREFYEKELGARAGYRSPRNAAAQWPNVKLGGQAYFIREKQKPVLLALQQHDDGKTSIEIKVAPFAEPQVLEADQDVFGLPRPKMSKTSGGTGGQSRREVHAMVMAEVGTVLAFYRREMAARNWKEEAQGAVLKPEEVELNFSSAEGTAVLKLTQKYGLTRVSIVQQVAKSSVKAEPAPESRTRHPRRYGRRAHEAGAGNGARGHRRCGRPQAAENGAGRSTRGNLARACGRRRAGAACRKTPKTSTSPLASSSSAARPTSKP